MTGIGEKALAQPVKPPLRERCACLAKLVKNRLTLTGDNPGRLRSEASFAAWVGLTPSEHSSGESDRRGAITKAGNKHLRKTLVEAAWHYLTCSGRPKEPARGQDPDPGARRHAAKGVRRLAERREALLARGVHGNNANVATARELACWVWAVGLMAEEA